MKHGGDAPELAATANISAFNIANAMGGLIGGAVVDSSLGPAFIPFAAIIVPAIGLASSFGRNGDPRPSPLPLNPKFKHVPNLTGESP